jgi:Zn-dependent protease with chaperone function
LKYLNLSAIFILLSFAAGAQPYMDKPFEPRQKNEDDSALVAQIQSFYEKIPPEPGLSPAQQDILDKAYKTRLKACRSLLESDDVILSGGLYDYVNGCFGKLLAANPAIDQRSQLVLFSDISYNAFTMGDNIVFVHTGLVEQLYNEEELAFVMAHELAHNSGGHMHTALLAAAQLMTDEELMKGMRRASRKSYGNVTALNELLLPSILRNREESRRHELEADSLGFVYYRNAGYDPQKTMGVFRSMEMAENGKAGTPVDFVKLFGLSETDPVYRKATAYRPSSSLGTFEKDNEMEGYLRSHPYQRDRLTSVARIGALVADTLYERQKDPVYEAHRYIAGGELVQSSFKDQRLSQAFYYSAKMQQDFPGDPWSRNSLALVLAQLSYAKERRISGRYLDLQSPGFDESYDKAICFVTSISPAESQLLSEKVLEGAPQAYEDFAQNKVTRTIWAFEKQQYEQFELRKSLVEEDPQVAIYKPFLKEINDYYIISGKSKHK